jgi:hypothetical protein
MTSNRDNATLVQMLFEALVKSMHQRMKDGPTAADLTTARRMVQTWGQHLTANGEAEQQKLKAIRMLYLQRLQEALEGDPSAAVLHEVFVFLSAAGCIDGIGSYVDAHKVLRQLVHSDLPFQ